MKAVRTAAMALGILFLVLLLLVVLIPRLVSIESLRPRIVAAMEKKTGRKIGLERISLTFFPGIGVKISGLTVSGGDRQPEEPFLTVPEGEVRLAIGPLFSGRAEFTTFILSRPKILFRKHADGTHSATEIAARLAQKEKSPEAPLPASGEKVSIAIRTVRIENAELSLRIEERTGAETRWDIAPFTFRLGGIGGVKNDFEIATRIEGAARGEVSFAGSSVRERGPVSDPSMFDLRGEGSVFGQKVVVEGKMSAPEWPAEVDLTVTLPGIEMDKLVSVLKDPPAALRDARLEGKGELVLKVSGNLQSLGIEGEADLTRAGWTLSRDPEIRKFIDTPCRAVLQGHWFPDLFVVSNAELSTSPLLIIANASTVPSTGEREWVVSSQVSSLAEFGKIRGGGLNAFSPAGRLTVSGKGKRTRHGEEENYHMQADLFEVGFRVPGKRMELRSLNGHVELTPRKVEFAPLAGLFNGQRFSLRGKAALGPAPAGQVDFRMAYLDVDALFPPGDGKKGGEGKAAPAEKKGKEPAERGDLSVRVNLEVDAGKARGMEFRDLRGLARYEKKTLFLDAVRAGMYGGEVAVTGRVGLSGPSPDFRVKLEVKNLPAEEILSRQTSLKDLLVGPVNLSADLGGKAGDFAEFSRTAAGTGSLRMAGGTIRGLDLPATAAGLAGLSHLVPGKAAGGGRKETPFSEFATDFRIDAGKIRTDALRIVSRKMALSGKAALGFDKTIDFQGWLRLPEIHSRSAKAGKFLAGPNGQVEIPLVFSGPVTAPGIAIDAEALARGAAGNLLRGLADRVTAPAKAPPADNTARQEPEKKVEELLRKLLPGE